MHILMKTKLYVGLIALLLMTVTSAFIQPANPVGTGLYNVGDVVANFRLRNVDGRMVSLSDYKNSKGVIIVFTTNHCPFAKAYEERILDLDRKYATQGFPVIAIQPNDPTAYDEDSFDNMKARSQEKGYTFPYLVDETQEVSRAFGATRTPEAYILKRNGDRFVVQYIGTIDDSPQSTTDVRKRYVEEALNNLLVDRPVVNANTKAIGCAIKWKGM